jgi:hypothetical protein
MYRAPFGRKSGLRQLPVDGIRIVFGIALRGPHIGVLEAIQRLKSVGRPKFVVQEDRFAALVSGNHASVGL